MATITNPIAVSEFNNEFDHHFVVIHPPDDLPEEKKVDTESLGPMPMTWKRAPLSHEPPRVLGADDAGAVSRIDAGRTVRPSAQVLENRGMAEYRHTAHATFDLKYHVIWITWRGVAGPHPHAVVGTATSGARQASAIHQGSVVAQAARGVPRIAQRKLTA